MAEAWVPRSLRGTESEIAYIQVLHEGVPEHMRSSLEVWVEQCHGGKPDLLRRIHRHLRWEDLSSGGVGGFAILRNLITDDDSMLDLVDYLLMDLQNRYYRSDQLSGVISGGARISTEIRITTLQWAGLRKSALVFSARPTRLGKFA
jgi:hypothetical protein